MRKVAVATTGFFDGVHAGHRHIIDSLVSLARKRGDEAVVVTFWPHPRTVLQNGARELRLLSSLEEKKRILYSLGVDRVEVLDFSRDFAALTAGRYIREVLVGRLGVSAVVVGYDNRVGSDLCSGEDLRKECLDAGVECFLLDSVSFRGNLVVSSTIIRRSLESGDVREAGSMLCAPYGLYGVVVAGNRLGRQMGYPTANMQLYEPLKLIPANGVYAVDVDVLGRKYMGMCNIGVRPTVGGGARTVETHILDFNQDIYGLPIGISFVSRIRPERKFPGLEALKQQLFRDEAAVRSIMEGKTAP